MIRRYYRADYISKAGDVIESYSFQAPTRLLAEAKAQVYKQGRNHSRRIRTKVYLVGKYYPDPEPPKKRGRPRKD